jgi:hypothetical protein
MCDCTNHETVFFNGMPQPEASIRRIPTANGFVQTQYSRYGISGQYGFLM